MHLTGNFWVKRGSLKQRSNINRFTYSTLSFNISGSHPLAQLVAHALPRSD